MTPMSLENFSDSNVKKPVLNKLELEKDLLIYLDQENIFKELESVAAQYEKNIISLRKNGNFILPFRFQLKLDLIRIQEISEKLFNLFLKEPDASIDLVKNVIFCACNLLIPDAELQKSDLQVIIFVIGLPVTNEISDLLHYPSYGLESIQGVLIGKTTISKYVRSSIYFCELELCPGNKRRRYPENHGNICPTCFSLMAEEMSSTDTGEEIICHFISLKAYQTGGRFQAITVRIRDELCSLVDLQVGEEYKITGRLTKKFFEAMNVETKQSTPETFTNLPHPQFFSVPKSISELYIRVSEICPNCPWSFVIAISSLLGSHLIPTSSFLHLKLGLMLSLSTQKSDENPVPLVAVGTDSLNSEILFHAAGNLGERYLRLSTAHSYLGGAAKPGPQSGVIWEEAGQLILAANGVCNLGDWSKFKKEQANYICQTVESGQIALNKGELEKTNLINFVPLKCAVWTYWCHITTSRNHQLQLKTLINVFGIPFLAEEKNEVEMNKICLKSLERAMKNTGNKSNTDVIPSKDLKDFIEIINSRELILRDSACQLIRNYFVVSRRERPHCLPLGAIKTITSLARGHARLALRNEVLYEDVVAIIFLYEESISALYGETMNSYQKLIWNQEEPLYVWMGKQIEQFQLWLEEYVSYL